MRRTKLSIFLLMATAAFGCSDARDVLSTAPNDSSGKGRPVPPEPSEPGEAPCPVKPVPHPTQCKWTDVNQGLYGGQVTDVAYDGRKPNVAWAASGRTVYRSVDAGVTWQSYAKTPAPIRRFAFPQGEPEVLFASSTSGVLRSDDGGKTWSTIALNGLSLSSIAIDPFSSKRIYVAGFATGLLVSSDGGKQFSEDVRTFPGIPAPDGDIRFILPSATNLGEIVVGGSRLDNHGFVVRALPNAGWTEALDTDYLYSLSRCAADPNQMLAGTRENLRKSTDGGITWTVPFSKLVTAADFAATSCERIYLTEWSSQIGVRSSNDGGATFSSLSTEGIPFQYKAPFSFAVDPSNSDHFISPSQGGILQSSDAAKTFSLVGALLGLQIREIRANSAGDLWLASWGSGYWRKPASGSWEHSASLEDYAFVLELDPSGAPLPSFDPAVPSNIPTNTFDVAFQPGNPSVRLASSQVLGVLKSTDGGAHWTEKNNGLPSAWSTPNGTFIDTRWTVFSDAEPSRAVVGTAGKGLFYSTDAGESWNAVSLITNDSVVSALAFAPGVGFVAAIEGDGVFRSTDGNVWARSNVGLTSLDVYDLEVGAGRIFAGTSRGIFVSVDGVSWTEFDNACAPEGAGGRLAVQGGANPALYTSSVAGVFRHPL